MKTNTVKTDMATPRPWKACLNVPTAVIPGHIIKRDDDVESPVALLWEGGGTKGKPTQLANIALIVTAVNEFEYLNAIVEAAKYERGAMGIRSKEMNLALSRLDHLRKQSK